MVSIENNLNWLKYFSPLAGIIFCPVTILFLWTVWTGPIESDTSIPSMELPG